jgi:hypothetical protein
MSRNDQSAARRLHDDKSAAHRLRDGDSAPVDTDALPRKPTYVASGLVECGEVNSSGETYRNTAYERQQKACKRLF